MRSTARDPETSTFSLRVDRGAGQPIAAQIRDGIAAAIRDGRLAADARLPSWRDLAAQLGIARGTVREAYERLADEQLVVARGAAGTHVAARARPATSPAGSAAENPPIPELFHDFGAAPLAFQMGVPAQDAFPTKLWSRLMARGARAGAAAPVGYPDPRGHPELRREIAAYLGLARGIRCSPGQVLITNGFAAGLGLAIHGLGPSGEAWIEEPGFPLTRMALAAAQLRPRAIPVDAEGLDVEAGARIAPSAGFVVVTPGQHAPLGMTMSLERRLALLAWTGRTGAWIVEDDYLSELQLRGRAAPALASLDPDARVLHIGSFSKTISPALRLGFVVVPADLAARFGNVAALLAPAPASSIQRAVAEFLRQGHYLRHLRRMKRLYAARQLALATELRRAVGARGRVDVGGGLGVRLLLPGHIDDVAVAADALAFGMAPVPLSPWFETTQRRHGLLLGVTNLVEQRLAGDCERLAQLIDRHSR